MDWKNIINEDWTLFLDRDGVINVRIIDGYVTKINEFEFLPNVIEALKIFKKNDTISIYILFISLFLSIS